MNAEKKLYPPAERVCPRCRHSWSYHTDEGCEDQVQISGAPGWYDCNCTERKP